MMEKPLIGIDCDDVLLNFVETFILWHNKKYGTTAKLTDHTTYYFFSSLGINEEESAQRVAAFGLTQTYHNLPPMPGAKAFLQELSKHATLVVITARQHHHAEITKRNIEMHFPGLISRIIHAPRLEGPDADIVKARICAQEGIAVLIDDNHANLAHCAAHTPRVPGIIYTQPWNQQVICDKTRRGHTHEEIIKHVLEILETTTHTKEHLPRILTS